MKTRRRLHARRNMKERRRTLRRQATPAERALWRVLRKRQLKGRKFRRQYSIGSYVVDFYCPDEHLAIELDGEGHNDVARYSYEDARERLLRKQGVKVLRFENRDVFENLDSVTEESAGTLATMTTKPPNPASHVTRKT